MFQNKQNYCYNNWCNSLLYPAEKVELGDGNRLFHSARQCNQCTTRYFIIPLISIQCYTSSYYTNNFVSIAEVRIDFCPGNDMDKNLFHVTRGQISTLRRTNEQTNLETEKNAPPLDDNNIPSYPTTTVQNMEKPFVHLHPGSNTITNPTIV